MAGKLIEGYVVRGPVCVVARGSRAVVVAQSTLPGKRWLRFFKKINARGWHVTAYKTKREATHDQPCR